MSQSATPTIQAQTNIFENGKALLKFITENNDRKVHVKTYVAEMAHSKATQLGLSCSVNVDTLRQRLETFKFQYTKTVRRKSAMQSAPQEGILLDTHVFHLISWQPKAPIASKVPTEKENVPPPGESIMGRRKRPLEVLQGETNSRNMVKNMRREKTILRAKLNTQRCLLEEINQDHQQMDSIKHELEASKEKETEVNTKTEVEKRFSPAELESFPDMPPSNNISEGILGMTKSAHRKAPNTDTRSINGKILWRPNDVAADVAAMPPDERAKVLQYAVKEARSLSSFTDNRREMASLKYSHFECQQAEARKKEEARRERTQALQAMQPARTKQEVDTLMEQTGAAQILRTHLKALMAHEGTKLAGIRLKDAGGGSKAAYYKLYMDCLDRMEASDDRV